MAELLSEGARVLQRAMWALIVLSILALGLAFAGTRGWVARDSIPSSLLMFGGSLFGALYLGFKAHRRALADRERDSSQAMVIAIATQLGRQDDAMLERIARKGGPAAEAARMILSGRRSGQAGSPSANRATGT